MESLREGSQLWGDCRFGGCVPVGIEGPVGMKRVGVAGPQIKSRRPKKKSTGSNKKRTRKVVLGELSKVKTEKIGRRPKTQNGFAKRGSNLTAKYGLAPGGGRQKEGILPPEPRSASNQGTGGEEKSGGQAGNLGIAGQLARGWKRENQSGAWWARAHKKPENLPQGPCADQT